eukprot:5463648-Prymnesium_polylepis.1
MCDVMAQAFFGFTTAMRFGQHTYSSSLYHDAPAKPLLMTGSTSGVYTLSVRKVNPTTSPPLVERHTVTAPM